MNLFISNSSAQPIYEQIYNQIKALIIVGAIPEGEMLPSIRGLAKDMRISVITTKRAYEELERDGYINTVAGRGCFVAKTNNEMLREETFKQIEEHLTVAVELANGCGITREELIDIIKLI